MVNAADMRGSSHALECHPPLPAFVADAIDRLRANKGRRPSHTQRVEPVFARFISIAMRPAPTTLRKQCTSAAMSLVKASDVYQRKTCTSPMHKLQHAAHP